ncbi:MAG: CBS domain-containing protein [Bdellovibrionales bacterium]|nr:CBS domain-containing protein [Bdellovibrionales bacterium]
MEHPNANEVMSKHLITIGYEDALEAAYEKMQNKRIRHLAVADEFGAVIGVISDRDIQRAMKPKKNKYDMEYTFDSKHRVKDYMSFPALQVRADVQVAEIVERMLKEKVSAFLVTERHTPVGIVTTDDLLKLLGRILQEDGPSGKMKFSLGELIFGDYGGV